MSRTNVTESIIFITGLSRRPEFSLPNSNFTCPGDILTFECTTVGPGTTVWNGSAFNCDQGNEINLRHSQLLDNRMECNGGAIFGNIVHHDNNCFVSQLNITASITISGTVSCFHDNTRSINHIGTGLVNISAGRLTNLI